METLTFNGVLSSDYGVYVIGNNDAEAPTFDYTPTEIARQTRDIHESNFRLKNKDVIYHCVCKQNADVNVPKFVSALLQDSIYKRLVDTIHPEYYKVGTFYGGTQPQFYGSKDVATFDLAFDCDPRKFLVSGETFIDLTPGTYYWLDNARRGLYYNPLFYASEIYDFRIYRQKVAGGSLTYYSAVSFTSDAPSIYFDTETKFAYSGTTSLDQYITGFDTVRPSVRYPGVDYQVGILARSRTGATNPMAKVALREYIL